MFQIASFQSEKPVNIKITEDTGSRDRSMLKLTRYCQNPDLILIATVDDVAVGVISTRKADKLADEIDSRGYLDGIFINEEYKNLGIETELFRELLRKVKAQGKSHLCVIADAPPIVAPDGLGELEELLEKQEIDF